MTYSTQTPDGQVTGAGSETEVLLPERHYPHGYAVGASGAEVTSAPNERVLKLVAEPGQESVAVRVERA
jgi:endoglycosylceramidase